MPLSKASIRRLIYLAIFLSISLGLIFNVNLNQSVSPETEQFYQYLDAVSDSQYIMISFDFEASSLAEVQPLAEACLNHAFKNNLKVVGISLFAEGTALGEKILRDLADKYNKEYGTDYMYLGFFPSYVSAMLGMGASIETIFPLDYYGKQYSEFPIANNLHNYKQIGLVISVADGSMPTYWAEYAVAKHDAKVAVALTGSMATAYYPYLTSGQFVGLIAGLKGAAEYELLLGESGAGKRGSFALTLSQIVVLLVIIFGNVSEFRRRKR